MAPQCVVAVSPSSRPAAASTSDPVHTDVVNVVVSWAVRTQSSTALVVHERRGCRRRRGTRRRRARRSSSNVASTSMPRKPLSERTIPRSWPTNVTSKPGMRCSTSYGPMPSSAVKRGNRGMAMVGHDDVVLPVGEAAAVVVGRGAEVADERAAHRLGACRSRPRAAIAATVSSPSSSSRRAASTRHVGDVAGRRDADLGGEAAQEVALAEGDAAGEHAEAVIGGGVGLDELLGPADRLVARPVAPHRGGELALAAGPAQEHHEPAGARLGDLDAVVVLDEGQRDVDAGGHAGRRPDVAVARPDRVGVDVDGRVLGGEPLGARPVGRRPACRRAGRRRRARTRRCTR